MPEYTVNGPLYAAKLSFLIAASYGSGDVPASRSEQKPLTVDKASKRSAKKRVGVWVAVNERLNPMNPGLYIADGFILAGVPR
jgi:hypothetical protein